MAMRAAWDFSVLFPSKMALTVMKPLNSPLARKLALVLVLKLAVLLALWWGFVRNQRIHVDGDNVAAQLLQPVATPAKPENGAKP